MVNAPEAPSASGGYSQAVEVTGATRTLYVSGQVPVAQDGSVPETFDKQCRLAWRNVEAQLRAADMGLSDIAKVTTFLADRRFADENSAIRRDVLGTLAPALTVVIAGIFDESWLLEIEVIAAA